MPNVSLVAQMLAALIMILVATRLFGALGARVGQPPVMGEILAGIVLGPSLLGHLWPQLTAAVFSPEVISLLGAMAQLGIILFVFLVGLNIDIAILRSHRRTALSISLASIALPLVAGMLLAGPLAVLYPGPTTAHTAFALFIGIAMAITALPVLASLLADLGLVGSPMGQLTLACAAFDDVTAWCLLALVTGLVKGNVDHAATTAALALVFACIVLIGARPLLQRLDRAATRTGWTPKVLGLALISIFACALATEAIGVHALFGAFLLGVAMPGATSAAADLRHRLESFVAAFLLPIFFANTGLRTAIGLVDRAEHWLWVGIIVAVAIVSKAGGAFASARACGLTTPDAARVGILMNCRGLMGLVVLNVGHDLGLLSPLLFTMFVVMTVATTFMTSPAFNWMNGPTAWSQANAPSRGPHSRGN